MIDILDKIMSQTVENISQMFSNHWIKESINFGKSVTSNWGKKKPEPL